MDQIKFSEYPKWEEQSLLGIRTVLMAQLHMRGSADRHFKQRNYTFEAEEIPSYYQLKILLEDYRSCTRVVVVELSELAKVQLSLLHLAFGGWLKVARVFYRRRFSFGADSVSCAFHITMCRHWLVTNSFHIFVNSSEGCEGYRN
ncbi:hypothetical protein Trydic_g4454 [Trypoxylus dichotomus]